MSIMGHKYFCKSNTGVGWTLFSVDTCERCGAVCEAPNSVGTPSDKLLLLECGMVERMLPVSDLMWCDDLDMAVCYDCCTESGR